LKGYRFRLQAVLDFRSKEVDLCQGKVALEEKKRVDILNLIRTRDEEIRLAYLDQQVAMETGDSSHGGVDLNRAKVFQFYVNRMKNEQSALQIKLSQQAQRVNLAREELKQAMIKKKSLEILEEKERHRFIQKRDKAEEAFLSELALNRMIHQSIQ
jgi:flagellar export protein FliJ